MHVDIRALSPNINFVSIELINKFDMSLIYKMNMNGLSIYP